MKNTAHLLQEINRQKVLPLFYNPDVEVSKLLLRALYAQGIRVVEFTNRGPASQEVFKALKTWLNTEYPDFLLGIGTIKNKKAAEDFIALQADFIVAPGINEDVALAAQEAQLLWIPGCMTPTEIMKAESLGAQLIKLFPAQNIAPNFIKAIQSVFPNLLFMPTGGVSSQNSHEWFANGAFAVGIGSQLISKEILETHNYDEIKMTIKNEIDKI